MSSTNLPSVDTKADHQAAILAKKTNKSTGQQINVDPAIIAALLPAYTFIQATALGGSLWCQTAKIETTFSPSTPKDTGGSDPVPAYFFLKTTRGHIAKKMFTGEFAGMTALHEALPEFAPNPIAFGPCSDNDDDEPSYFFLEAYIPMSPSHPLNPHAFCSRLSQLHKSTAGTSPTGKFGFGVTTCNGTIEQPIEWEERWDFFFAKGLRRMVDSYERITSQVNGTGGGLERVNNELRNAVNRMCEVVIPHLLSPERLKDSVTGEPVKPCLVHGDLWIGNTGINMDTGGTPVIFDPAAFYAHNEYELGNWVPDRCGFGGLEGEFVREYKRLYSPAEPRGEFEDRVRLYSFRFELHFCCLFPGQDEPARVMKALCEKYL
ncbi:Fructosamine kinase-domain-containing protein [Pseudoneurospora amorphoporcata]|uniref:protein-ribulosamine 3-kinase n=1 Tax=Pseudoneurospora amorphoporcata TaxID=241081 RepID=A0AAN6NP06_9PEZI|nr:Fructosamine kinase-domain-containing protein [Pseudoneurospora amorphoporcata]